MLFGVDTLWDQRPRQSAGEAAGVNRRQRTETPRLVRRHFNAHICSSANLTRISKVKILNSNINFEVRKFKVRLTALLSNKVSRCVPQEFTTSQCTWSRS